MSGPIRQRANQGVGQYQRVQASSTVNSVSTGATTLWRVVASNASTATATATITESTVVTLTVMRVPAGETKSAEFGVDVSALRVQNSSTLLDTVVVFG